MEQGIYALSSFLFYYGSICHCWPFCETGNVSWIIIDVCRKHVVYCYRIQWRNVVPLSVCSLVVVITLAIQGGSRYKGKICDSRDSIAPLGHKLSDQ